MAKIAIMGFGTVGSGVLEVCRRNAASIARRAGEPVEVKYILDVRDFSGSPDAALFTKSIDTILNDPEIKVVVETIGGTKFAYPYVRQCLESGRSVCTSNKEMVARGFPAIELFRQGCGRGMPRPFPAVTRLCGSPPRTAGGTGGSASRPPASASCRCGL